MKLFTKSIDEQLFKQYPLGSNLENQMVVAKIFNPYGQGTWYLLNSDESDPDYIWAIVDLFDVEMGSVSRSELESIKVPPFNLGLERDLYFTPINASELLERLQKGEQFAHGGEVVDNYKETTLSKMDFLGELIKRVVNVDKDGNPRTEDSKEYWNNRMMRFIMNDSYMFDPLDFLYRAYLSGLYHLEDINERTLGTTEEELSEVTSTYEDSGEGFGSSDFTYLLRSFLSGQGIKTDFVEHRLERLDEQGNVVARSQRSRFDEGGEMDTYSYARVLGRESQDWDSEAREYAGEEWDNLSDDEKQEIKNELEKGWDKNTHYAKGGHMDGEWVVYDPENDKIHSTHKTHRGAKQAMDKMFKEGEHESIGRMSKTEWDRYHNKMAKGGAIYSSDSLYILQVLKDGEEVGREKFRAKSLKEAREIAEDEFEKEYQSKFGHHLNFIVSEAMANGGETDTEILTSKGGDAWLFPSQPNESSYGIKLAMGGMTAGRWYRDNQGQEYRYLGEDSTGNQLFSDGEKTLTKPESDFEALPKEKKLFGFFNKGGEVAEKWVNSVRKMRGEVSQIVLKDGSKVTGKKLHEIMSKGGMAKKFEKKPREKRVSPTLEKLKKGGLMKKKSTFDDKVKAISKNLEGTKVKSKYKKEYGARYDRKEAKEAAQKIAGAMKKKGMK